MLSGTAQAFLDQVMPLVSTLVTLVKVPPCPSCRNIGLPAGGRASGQEQQAARALDHMARASGPSLAEVLKPEVIIPLLQVCLTLYLPLPWSNQQTPHSWVLQSIPNPHLTQASVACTFLDGKTIIGAPL